MNELNGNILMLLKGSIRSFRKVLALNPRDASLDKRSANDRKDERMEGFRCFFPCEEVFFPLKRDQYCDTSYF